MAWGWGTAELRSLYDLSMWIGSSDHTARRHPRHRAARRRHAPVPESSLQSMLKITRPPKANIELLLYYRNSIRIHMYHGTEKHLGRRYTSRPRCRSQVEVQVR